MGHLSETGLKRLRTMADGMNERRPDGLCICEACAQGRTKERPHNTSLCKGRWRMDVIHTDVAGPFRIPGFNGCRYWVTFLDDFTQWAEIQAIKERSEVSDRLINFVETHTTPECRTSLVHQDRGGENISDKTKAWAQHEGIILSYTDTEQHQANGCAEVLNRIIEDKLTPTLLAAGLNIQWWPYILEHGIAYVRNRSPCARHKTTPYQAWTQVKPNLSNIRKIGSRAFVMRPSTKRSKVVTPKADEQKLLGFKGRHTYLVTAPGNKAEWRTNIIFIEDRPHTDSDKSLKPMRKPDESSSRYSEPEPFAKPGGQVETLKPLLVPDESGNYSEPEPFTEPLDHVETQPILVPNESCDQHSDLEPFTELGGQVIAETQSKAPQMTNDELSDYTSPASIADDQPAQSIADNQPGQSTVDDQPAQIRRLRASPGPELVVIGPRQRKPIQHHFGFHLLCHTLMAASLLTEPYEPRSYGEARNSGNWSEWKTAMDDELKSHRLNRTWKLKKRSELNGKRVLRGRWVFKIKRGPDGSIQKYKARWVVRGFEQEQGSDYTDTFASVVKPMSYKALFAIAAARDHEIHQMDVKTAFLYGDVEEEIYVEQPTGYEESSAEGDESIAMVCNLLKALYGLKQSPRIWYYTLTTFLESLGFAPLDSDLSVYVKEDTIIAIYVDDLLIVSPKTSNVLAVKSALSKQFSMTDLGECNYYLGMTIRRDRANRAISLGQRAYVEKVLKDHDLWSNVKTAAVPMNPGIRLVPAASGFQASDTLRTRYQQAVGSLMYAMMGTRPDIAFAVSIVSRFASNPDNTHWLAIQQIFRYLRGTVDYELVYSGSLSPLVGYTDSDWAGDVVTRRSTSGYTFNLGSGAITWSSKRQPTISLSTCEAEYIGQTQATKEAVWLRNLLRELGHEQLQATVIFGDNQGAIALAKNPQFHGRSKHIDTQWHYVREKIGDNTVELQWTETSKQVADGLTKPLNKELFIRFRKALGLEARS